MEESKLYSREYRDIFRKAIVNYVGTDEMWAFHPNCETILVSSYGRVKNMATNVELKQSVNSNGYLGVNLVFSDVGRRFTLVHRLVLETFCDYIGNRNYFYETNHINGNKKDNRLENLEWLTRKENLDHARTSGILKKYAHTKNRKCTLQDAIDMAELKRLGFTVANIASSYNIDRNTCTKYIREGSK